jgi:DUF4097 and DUF4098 domain-containing protein YvlB
MILGIAAAALALGLAVQQTDTTFAVRGGSRLVLDAHDGAAVVGIWDRHQIRVRATHADRGSVSIRQSASGVRIEAEGDHGPARGVRFEITVPREFGVAIDGVNIVATVDGVHGNIDVENVEGDITIRNVVGDVALESVSGSVTVENLRGNLSAESMNQGFRITGVRGNIEAETVNGSIVMRSIEASNVEANTINGIIEYDGTVRDDGRYYLGAFNGQITMSIPERTNASITVHTANGRIDTSFPVPLQSTRENRISFNVGTGSARVELESYNGTISLVRPRGR